MEKIALGADIGGSHITCQLINLDIRQPVENTLCRVEVNSGASKDEILGKWISAIRQAVKNTTMESLAGMGFAMPGPFGYANGIAWFRGVRKFESLYGVNVREEIQHRLNLPAEFPVRFLNDAACFAIGEAWLGEASKYHRIIALTLGTGFGTTFLQDGHPVAGKDGIPEDGFLYHIPYKKSIADDYFSTRWLVREYMEKTGIAVPGVKDLAVRAKAEPVVENLFREFGHNLGEFLSSWLKNFNAECLILGGNIAKSYGLFRADMETELKNNGLSPIVCLAGPDDQAALSGSARLCDDAFYSGLIKAKII